MNKKFMQAPERQQSIGHQGAGKKRQWVFFLLGVFVIAGLGAGGFFVVKGHKMSLEGDEVQESRLVTESGH